MKKLLGFLEYLGGVSDRPPDGCGLTLESHWWGFWWFLLGFLILWFCGQSSKFIYIDF